jgi:CRISPR-associated protein (TIGR03986 family)
MSDVKRGRLVWSKDRKRRLIVFPTKKGESPPSVFDLDQLAAALRSRGEDVVEVDLELLAGKPVKIRPVGEAWSAAPAPPPPAPARPVPGQPAGRHGQRSQPAGPAPGPALRGEFHNPYNFVPAPPRSVGHPNLGDAKEEDLAGHDRYVAGRYSGVTRVNLTAMTPLLIVDAARATEDAHGHKTFPVRIGADGRPYLPPTSVKGMLRSAFEAITNSRFGVFAGHDERLAYRMPAAEGLRLVPVRVEQGPTGLQLRILRGTSAVGQGGKPVGGDPMYAAWLPRYKPGPAAAPAYPDGAPASGAEVFCWVELVRHHRWDRRGNRHVLDFTYWRVRVAAKSSKTLGTAPAASPVPPPRSGDSWHEPVPGTLTEVRGWVYVTNQNVNRKHDERVFFDDAPAPTYLPLTPELERSWGELIRNYQAIHVRDLAKRDAAKPRRRYDEYLGREPGQTAWSLHVYRRGADKLGPGDLAYAEVAVDGRGSVTAVTALYPVMISRGLHEAAPRDLVNATLLPAQNRSELSPADRVFGWVNQDGAGAYRGNLRVGPVVCRTPPEGALLDASAYPIPLAILGEPKPQQARFYVGETQNGDAQPPGRVKLAAGYRRGKGLRGRKVYAHHKGLPDGYWDRPEDDRTQIVASGWFQEYRRPHKATAQGRAILPGPDGTFELQTGAAAEQRDDQNRSVSGWVKPGTEFIMDLHISNLSNFELGALLWLLRLPPDHYHRLGGGKPLGFGSVRLELDAAGTDIRDGAEWERWYTTLAPAGPGPDGREARVEALRAECTGAFEQTVRNAPFLSAFLAAARGFGMPVHYPRSTPAPHPEGRAYEWFVNNDREQHGTCLGVPLGDLGNDPGLPYLG